MAVYRLGSRYKGFEKGEMAWENVIKTLHTTFVVVERELLASCLQMM